MPENMSHQPNKEILGLPAEPLVDVIDSADSLALLAHKSLLPLGVYRHTLQTAVDIWPLVEDVQRGNVVSPEDVRPHTDDIIDNIVTNPAVSDALARRGNHDDARKLRWLSRLRDVGLVRDQVRPQVEVRFSEQVKNVLQSDETKRRIEAGLEVAQPYVDVISDQENPREQFVTELGVVASEIRGQTRRARDARLQVERARYPANTFRGKVLRWRHRKKTPDELIRPRDAARGIDHVLNKTLTDDAETTSTPMLKAVIETALAETGRSAAEVTPPTSVRKLGVTIPRTQILEAAAPEIMQSLEAPLPEHRRDAQFLKSIRKRFSPKVKLGRFFKNLDLEILRRRGPRLLSGIRDVLPTSGREVRRAMDEIREVFLAG